MENKKTCGECRHISADSLYCKKLLCSLSSRDQVSPFCGEWEPKTNGDKIRQMSNEELAEYFVYEIGEMFASTLITDKTFDTYESAVDATEAYLNAPAESEVENV